MFQRGTLARMLGTAIAIAVSGSADLQAERLPLQISDASNGLAHNRIRCVLADSRGFLWFGTVDGRSRFDGSRFVNFGPEQGLPHPSVEEIVEAGPGVYWVATPGGLLNNVIRHAGATVVRIDVTVGARQLHVVVTDDGRGFDVASPTEGQGLRSLERRASSLGGSLQVTSSSGSGTRVTFSVPVT